MSKTIKQFDYLLVQMGKGDRLPFNPHVEIFLDHWMTASNDKAPRISGHLMTESEIDHHIQALKDDLDSIGRKAKLALQRAQAETKARVREV